MSNLHLINDSAGRAHRSNGATSMNANDGVPRASDQEKPQMSLFDHECIASPARQRPGQARWRKGAMLAVVSFLGVALITGTPAFIGTAGAQTAGTAKAE